MCDAGSTDPPAWSHLSVVPQGFALLEELTVAENIDLAAQFDLPAGRHRDDPARGDRVGALLTRLGLDRLQHRGAFEISVGERQRTMVARPLVDRPATILADEPVATRTSVTPEGGEAFVRDVPDAELHLLDTGHFAFEDHEDEIAGLIRAFYTTRVSRTVNTAA